MHQKRDAKRASTGIGPGLTEPARIPGVPFHGGMILPILAFDSPVAVQTYLTWGSMLLEAYEMGNGLILSDTLSANAL